MMPRCQAPQPLAKDNHMAKVEVTTVLAVWGAIVSTGLAAIRVQEYLHGREPHVQVSFHPNVLTPIFGDRESVVRFVRLTLAANCLFR